MKIREALIKITLAALMFLCLLDMPYGFYQFVRFIALIGFSVLAYLSNQKNHQIQTVVYIVLALLFQPFYKIALGRELWNIVDVIIGTCLLLSILMKSRTKTG